MTLRLAIISTFLFIFSLTFGQTLMTNFEGRIEYSIQYYSTFIKRDSCGDYYSKRTLTKTDDYFQISDSSMLENENETYLPTKFIRDKNCLKLIYYNPAKLINDTIDQFPLTEGDTIVSCEDFLVSADSLSSWSPTDNSWRFKEVQMSSINFSKTTNIGDTAIIILGQHYNCYRFEKFHYNRKSFHGRSHIRRIIYIDKSSLLPLREEWLSWCNNHPCKPEKQWTLTKNIEITEIKISR